MNIYALIAGLLGTTQAIVGFAGFILAFVGVLFADSPNPPKEYWFIMFGLIVLVLAQLVIQALISFYLKDNPNVYKWITIIFLLVNIFAIYWIKTSFFPSSNQETKKYEDVVKVNSEIKEYKSILKERALTAEELRTFVTFFKDTDSSVLANNELKKILDNEVTSSYMKKSIDEGGVLLFELSKYSLNEIGLTALIDAGADIEYTDNSKKSKNVLMEYIDTIETSHDDSTCNKGQISKTVLAFIDQGINMSHVDTDGYSALWYIEHKFNMLTKNGTEIPADTICINELSKAFGYIYARIPEGTKEHFETGYLDPLHIKKPINLFTAFYLANRVIDTTGTISSADSTYVIPKVTKDSEGYNFYHTTEKYYATKDIKYAIPDNSYIKVLFDGKAAYKSIVK